MVASGKLSMLLRTNSVSLLRALIRHCRLDIYNQRAVALEQPFPTSPQRGGNQIILGNVPPEIDLAFPAPDIIEQAISGTLPLHITSGYLIRIGVPSEWGEQQKMLANVGARTVR